jgi:acyl-CoA thioester hydrolase
LENSELFKNRLPIQVRFSDVDMMGHVSNTVYQNYFDSGKIAYFDEVIPELEFKDVTLVGASVKIDYIKPIFMRTRVLVETRVAMLGHKSITMEHQLVEEQSGEILSTCTAVLVCFSLRQQMSVLVPESWKSKILAYDEDVRMKD